MAKTRKPAKNRDDRTGTGIEGFGSGGSHAVKDRGRFSFEGPERRKQHAEDHPIFMV